MSEASPLFVKDRGSLLKSLRLDEDIRDESMARAVSDALIDARVGIYDSLGSGTVDSINATEATQTPSTSDQLRRARAASMETLWVKKLLIERLPSYIATATGVSLNDWNETNLVRQGPDGREVEINRLDQQVKEALDSLKGDDNPSAPNVTTIGPDETNKYPGEEFGV